MTETAGIEQKVLFRPQSSSFISSSRSLLSQNHFSISRQISVRRFKFKYQTRYNESSMQSLIKQLLFNKRRVALTYELFYPY